EAARLQQQPQRRRGNALAERRDHAPGHDDDLGHAPSPRGFPPDPAGRTLPEATKSVETTCVRNGTTIGCGLAFSPSPRAAARAVPAPASARACPRRRTAAPPAPP